MKRSSFILFAGDHLWRFRAGGGAALTDIAIPPNATPADIAETVVSALNDAGYRGQPVLLALPSTWCLCASISTAGLPRKDRRRAMAYRLEEKLPLAAEEVVADFIPSSPGDQQTLGVCVVKQKIAPLLTALEAKGLAISAISPTALLSLQGMIHAGNLRKGANASLELAIWPNAEQPEQTVEFFAMSDSRVAGWHLVASDPRDLAIQLKLAAHHSATARPDGSSGSLAIREIGLGDELQEVIAPHGEVQAIDADPLAAAAAFAGEVLAGTATPWINLRRDDLAARDALRHVRVPFTAAVAAMLLCVACIAAALLWRAGQYDQLAAQLADEQQAVFRNAFPGAAVPADVRSRLASDEKALRGVRGDGSLPPQAESRLLTLRDLLSHLPPPDALRYRVLDVRLDRERFTVEGQAASHGDADAIVASLRNGGLFQADPPRTEQLASLTSTADIGDKAGGQSKGVSFTISGIAVSAAPAGRSGK